MPDTPNPQAVDVYSTEEIDAKFAERDERLSELERRVTDLEEGATDPGPGPGPEPPVEGVNLTCTFEAPAGLTVGRAVALSAAVHNIGTVAVPAGEIIGVGFLLDGAAIGEQVAWASTQAGLAVGASVTLDSSSAPMHSGTWTPTEAGEHELTAYVDDTNRIPETTETDNRSSSSVTIADRPAGGGGGGGGSARVFAEDSLWNTPKNPQVFAAGADGFLSSTGWSLNGGPYSHPVAWASNADPIHRITVPTSWGWPGGTLEVHMPDDAVPAAGTDGHLSIVNLDNPDNLGGLDLWQLHSTGSRQWSCASHARFDVYGSGWGQASPFKSAGVTAAGAPTVAGTITAADLDAGAIDHALCAAADYGNQGGQGTCWTGQLWPAIASDVNGGPGPLAEGALLIVRGAMPGGLNADEQLVWHAASTFGVWIIDKLDGIPALYSDRSDRVNGAIHNVTAIMRGARMVQTW